MLCLDKINLKLVGICQLSHNILNSLPAKLSHLNVHLLEVLSVCKLILFVCLI